MANISELINNIGGTVAGLFNSNQVAAYPAFPKSGVDYSAIKPENWIAAPNSLYVFSIEPLNNTEPGNKSLSFLESVTRFFESTPSVEGFSPFDLPINPQELSQTENFAVKITPTQGGTSVQHSGNRYKDLIISGTTGVHAFRSLTGVDRTNGKAIFQPNTMRYRSGYEVFQHFRAWMKSYHQFKAEQPEKSENLVMIFKNFKDWEFLIVEPLKFSMKRDAARPLLYNYTINFRVLGHATPPQPDLSFFDQIDNALDVASSYLDVGRGILLKGSEIIRGVAGNVEELVENLRKVNLAVKAAKGIPLTLRDVAGDIEAKYLSERDALRLLLKIGNTTDAITDNPAAFENAGGDFETLPSDLSAFANAAKAASKESGKTRRSPKEEFAKRKAQLGNAANQLTIEDYPAAAQKAIALEQEKAANISRVKLVEIRESAEELEQRLNSALGLGDDTFNDIYGFVPDESAATSEETDLAFEVLHGLGKIIMGLDALLSNDDLFEINASIFSKDGSSNGPDSIGRGIFTFPDANGLVREGIVPVGATLEEIAVAELGDANRWTELAEINKLKFPYIVNDNSVGRRINHIVRSRGYVNPSDIRDLAIGYKFIVNSTAAGGWVNKESFLAEYVGGDKTEPSSWRFSYPSTDTVVEVLDRSEYAIFQDDEWSEISFSDLEVDSVLRPGDLIKIPANATSSETDLPGPAYNVVTAGLSKSEASLGVDLKLTADGDLETDPRGDLAVSFGYQNGGQAIVLKILTEKGELRNHPDLGVGLKVGGKMPSLSEVRARLFSSLTQDVRIREVRDVRITRENSALFVNFTVFFKELQAPVPISLPV